MQSHRFILITGGTVLILVHIYLHCYGVIAAGFIFHVLYISVSPGIVYNYHGHSHTCYLIGCMIGLST